MGKGTIPRHHLAPALLLLLWGLMALHGPAFARAGYVGIFGGGPLENHTESFIKDIQKSGFTEVIVWSIGISPNGDLAFNSYKMASNGSYVGNESLPHFVSDLAAMKQGSVKRITFSIGSSLAGDWETIQALVEAEGTGRNSILYKNFRALKEAIPSLDALDFDDETNYDKSSTVKFAVMVGRLGYHVMPDAYVDNTYWISLVAEINLQLPGTVDGVHLQSYCGGQGNDPCSDGWDFGPDVPVYPGLSVGDCDAYSPPEVEIQMRSWRSECKVTGGFMWIYDEIAGKHEASQYANAIKTGLKI